MDILYSIFTGIANNIFTQVPILIGIIAFMGLVLQKKPIEDIAGGTIRAVVGVVTLTIGIDVFVGGLVAFQAIVASAFGFDPPAAESTLNSFLENEGALAPLVIAFGFIVHMVFVRIFKSASYVYLTGHLMFWMSLVITASLVEAFGDIESWLLVLAGSLIIACYWTVQPLVVAPLVKKILGHEKYGMGHTTASLGLLAGYGAKALRLGSPERHDCEKLNLPRKISFFKDINVATAFIITLIMLTAISFADSQVLELQMGGSSLAPWAWGMTEALKFAAGIAIILFGVRLFLAEIVPAFKGISDKILPGSKPALDLPVLFPKSPTAVMVGFLASTVIFLLLMVIFALSGWFVLVPPMIMLFFGGGAGGVFGNAVAGWRGAVFGGILNGVILAFGQWISWGLYSSTAPELATLSDPDWFVIGWLILLVGGLFSAAGNLGIWLLMIFFVVATKIYLIVLEVKNPGSLSYKLFARVLHRRKE